MKQFDVLLVDDDPIDLKLMQRALNKASDDVHIATAMNGRLALEALSEGDLPDIIVTDLKMPVMDGFDFLEQLKSDERLSLIPTIVLSTSKDSNDVAMSYRKHAAAYLMKPDDIHRYTELSKSLLDFWGDKAELYDA